MVNLKHHDSSTCRGLTKGGSISKLAGSDCPVHLTPRGSYTASENVPGIEPTPPGPSAGRSEGDTSTTSKTLRSSGRRQFPRWKRGQDLTAILLTSPLWVPMMVLIGIWINLTSRGPVFFRQTRVGQGARHFTLLKFRSMKVGAETGTHEHHFRQLIETNTAMVKLDAHSDPRLIPGGRLLRAMGLDELPQLLNVIRGEMSLVGPRPCTVKEYDCYKEWQKARVNAPPGLTGYWQVNGKNRTTFSQMIEMDIKYGERMSPFLDLAILIATVPAVLLQVVESNWRVTSERDAAPSPPVVNGRATQLIS